MTRMLSLLVPLCLAACGFGSPDSSSNVPDAGEGGAGPDAGAEGEPESCGDGVCTEDESCSSCPADCGECEDCTSGDEEPEGVDYASEIQPLFDSRCTGCHGDSGGLSLSSYEGVVAGGSSGASVEPCDCERSVLWQKVGPNPPFGDRMPRDGPYLAESEQKLLCDWIDQGAEETYDPETCGSGDPSPPDECAEDCGDGVCSSGEDCESCAEDCGECDEPEDPEDETPPEFEGLERVDEVSESACAVSFEPASDDVTPPEELVYDVFAGPRDEVDLSEPIATLEREELSRDDDVLVGTVSREPGTRQDLIVRARDAAGNSDDNLEADDCDLR